MAHMKQDESVKVKKVIDDWFNAMTRKDLDGIYRPISDDYVQHLPGRPPVIGLSGFRGVIDEYLPVFGPVHYRESKITVSNSGDIAIDVGRHDHVVFDKSGGSSTVRDLHFITLKKVEDRWMINGISEMEF
jgi:ketosteroid isomerase-like protein